jgi:hypothetical protein
MIVALAVHEGFADMPDFRIIHHGSVCTVLAISEQARAFAEENIAVPEFCGAPHHFVHDTRPVMMLMEQMAEQGFEVDGL